MKFIEVVLVLILLVFSAHQSEHFLRNWQGPGGSITTDLYIPSVMYACGHGFVNVNPAEIPHLRTFLDFKEQSFSGDNIPEGMQYIEWDAYQQYHRYLVYTVGFIWRIFGVSWEVLRRFLIVLYVLTVLIVYLIARVFLPSVFSFCVAHLFTISRIPVIILPILRDFARAPFILLVILILFSLIRGMKTKKRFIFACLLLGLVCGLGLGFRRDLMMFFLLSVFILFLVPTERNIPSVWIRWLGVLLSIVIFVLASYPILRSFHRFGTLGWHDILMGFGTEHDDLVGLQRTNYERIPKYDDLMVSTTADTFCYYNESLDDYELFIKTNPELEKRKLLLAYIYWFPADILIRIYTAISRISDRILTSALPINIFRSLLSLAVLVIFTAMDFRRGLCMSGVLLFAMGIQSLQFSFRHNFYLVFIPYFLYALFLHWLVVGIYRLWLDGMENIKANVEAFKSIIKRFCLIGLMCVFLSVGLLIVLRQVQSYQLTRLFQEYHKSELVTIPYTTYKTNNGIVYALEKPLSIHFGEAFSVDCSFLTNILVVDFSVTRFPACFDVLYEGVNDFSHRLTIVNHISSEAHPKHVRYYLPVYENVRDLKSNWNRFIGVRIEDSDTVQIVNMYKVCNLDKIPLLINCYFIEDILPTLYQQMASYSTSLINPCWRPYGLSPKQERINNANKEYINGNKARAYEILSDAMIEEPYSLMYGFGLAELYALDGESDRAKRVLIQTLTNRPHDPIPAMRLDAFLERCNIFTEAKCQFWEEMTQQIPHSSVAWLLQAKYQADTNIAKESLAKAVELNSDILLSTPFTGLYHDVMDILSRAMQNKTDRDSSRCPSISIRRQISYMLTMGIYLLERGEYQKAKDTMELLVGIKPQYYFVYPPLISLLRKGEDADLETVLYYCKTLISLIPYKLEPILEIEDVHTNNYLLTEREWISIWEELENKQPDSPCILCGLGRAYELGGDRIKAEQVYRRGIRYARKSEECAQLAYYRLAKLLYLSGKKEKAVKTLKKAVRRYPNNSALATLLDEYK